MVGSVRMLRDQKIVGGKVAKTHEDNTSGRDERPVTRSRKPPIGTEKVVGACDELKEAR